LKICPLKGNFFAIEERFAKGEKLFVFFARLKRSPCSETKK